MKFYVKHLQGFCVTYLHNPFECEKCLDMMDSEDEDFKEIFYKLYPKKKYNEKTIVNKGVPLDNSVSKTQTVTNESNILTPLQSPRTSLISKLSKRKSFNAMHLESYRPSTPSKTINKEKASPKSSKKNRPEKNEKKQSSKSVRKLSDKIPGRGTLKRKRWFLNKLQQKNENYEDDLFADQKFGHFQKLLQDESDCPESYTGLKTPIFPFSLSPRERTPSPKYIDCYSAEELSLSRKREEEYQYRLKKRKKLDLPPEKKESETPQVVQEDKPSIILERLLQVQKMLNIQKEEEENSDTEDDQYFSDIFKQ